MGIMRNDTRLRASLSITISSLLVLALITVAAVPLAAEGGDSDDRTGLTITMTGETEQIEFELSISSTEGGSVQVPGEGVFSYSVDTVVDLKAVADDDFRFVEWTGDTDSITSVVAAQTTIKVDADYSITAAFEEESFSPSPPAQYDLVVTSTVGGSVTVPGEGRFEYEEGAVVDLVAEPAEGYRFAEWTGEVSTVADVNSGATSIIIDGDYHIMAGFDPVPVPDSSAFPWWWILIGLVIAGLLVYFLWWRRRGRAGSAAPEG